MRKILLLGCITGSILLCQYFFSGCNAKKQVPAGEEKLKQWFYAKSDSLLYKLQSLDSAVNNKAALPLLQQYFKESRLLFKKTEAITEYYFQGLTKRINGPVLPDVKTEDGQVWPPHGFQVIEQFIFAELGDSLRKPLSDEIKLLQNDLKFCRSNMEQMRILPSHFNELTQQEMVRIAALGITGFDSPVAFYSLTETTAAIEGLTGMAAAFHPADQAKLNSIAQDAIRYLHSNNDFNAFNRMDFLLQNMVPLGNALLALDTVVKKNGGAFSGSFENWLKGEGFNADYYSPYAAAAANPAKVTLGKKLFFDTRLSATGKISCGTCHKPEYYFTDGKTRADNFVHGGSLQRNTPTLYYAALQSHQFYDLRSVSLEDQAHDVMKSSNEFNLQAQQAASLLNTDTVYKKLFATAFSKTDSISAFEVRNAIAAYIRSLQPFASRFDDYIKGNKQALNTEEIKGFNLFVGKAKCGTCHFMPLFNGNIPPWYVRSESEIIGVPAKIQWGNARIDPDSGRYKINRLPELMFAFKTPTVRNVEQTAPYMHNGVFTNLDDVVEFYHKGGGVGIGIELQFQSLPFDSLQLDMQEKKQIVAFMRALTDKTEKP